MPSFISNFGKIVNSSKEREPANEFVVMTKEDNLIHNYFFYCDTYWDSRNCLSEIILKFPKQDHDRVTYWTDYIGLVYVYMGNDILKTFKINQTNYEIKQKAKPFFVGKVYDIYERYEQMIVQVHNIGGRFKQKIPKEFREQYINNQNVRDTFQAICEFVGVYFICPPQNVQDNSSQTPDGNVNDPETQKNLEDNTRKEIQDKSQKNTQKNNNQENNDQNINNQNTNDENNESQNNTQQISNGYSQISFDANGIITFNGTAIEESPNSEKTLLEIDDKTYDDFLEEGKDVIEDVKKFLNGEVFEEIHGDYLDYNAITIEPKSSSTSTPENVDSDPDTAESMQKTQKGAENLGNISKTQTQIRQNQLTTPLSQTESLTGTSQIGTGLSNYINKQRLTRG